MKSGVTSKCKLQEGKINGPLVLRADYLGYTSQQLEYGSSMDKEISISACKTSWSVNGDSTVTHTTSSCSQNKCNLLCDSNYFNCDDLEAIDVMGHTVGKDGAADTVAIPTGQTGATDPQTVQIFINVGTMHILRLNLEDQIDLIKQKIEDLEGIPSAEQILYRAGRLLGVGTLKLLDIKNDDTLNVSFQLRGGSATNLRKVFGDLSNKQLFRTSGTAEVDVSKRLRISKDVVITRHMMRGLPNTIKALVVDKVEDKVLEEGKIELTNLIQRSSKLEVEEKSNKELEKKVDILTDRINDLNTDLRAVQETNFGLQNQINTLKDEHKIFKDHLRDLVDGLAQRPVRSLNDNIQKIRDQLESPASPSSSSSESKKSKKKRKKTKSKQDRSPVSPISSSSSKQRNISTPPEKRKKKKSVDLTPRQNQSPTQTTHSEFCL